MEIKPQIRLNAMDKVQAFLFIAVIALLPFGRLSEIPILILGFWGSVHLVGHFSSIKSQPWFKSFSWFYFAFLALSVISSLDSYWPEKSWLVSLSSIRFYLMGVLLLNHLKSTQMLVVLIRWVALLMFIWSVDALIQAGLGFNLLGQESYPGRLTGVFGQNVKLGPVLALFLSLVLIQSYQFPQWMRWLLVPLVVVVILLSGTRSAWLMAAFVLAMFWWHHVKGRRLLLLLKVTGLSLVGLVSLWFISDDFQKRMERSVVVFQGDMKAIDYALADRLPIWQTALNMYQDHPINGVGARAFRKAYVAYAETNDVWVAQQGSGLHAHHWVLEILAETGTIGLLIFVAMLAWVVRLTRPCFQSNQVWPFGVALMAALLPVVSLYSLFSSFWSICLWWLVILLFMGVKNEQS
ncbi:O-antigen ligase family protein [Marinicella litoralis]|uniref:O-antigen ligase n=1 Tax=Marinicella litoralis TaxID=644220 RepID=A0A4R6XJB4_9GAMM|nr:O-antigen ligase family protein [Marinicella litoralis]TDR19592.1 O-antigen ligase [Marinicella litoralis]